MVLTRLPVRPVGDDNAVSRKLIHRLAPAERLHIRIGVAHAWLYVCAVRRTRIPATATSFLAVPAEVRDRRTPNFLISTRRGAKGNVQDDEEENGDYP